MKCNRHSDIYINGTTHLVLEYYDYCISKLLLLSETAVTDSSRPHLLMVCLSHSDEDDAKLQADLAEGYLRFLQAKDENQRQDGTRLAKRTKKAKVNIQEYIADAHTMVVAIDTLLVSSE